LLSDLIWNIPLEEDPRKLELELKGTNKLLVYADDVTILVENISTTKKNTKAHLNTSKEADIIVNANKTI
jgi:hypothetical protein